jgi:hypothetical protein
MGKIRFEQDGVSVEISGLDHIQDAMMARVEAALESSLQEVIGKRLDQTGALPAFVWTATDLDESGNPRLSVAAGDTEPTQPEVTVYVVRDALSIEEFQRIRAGEGRVADRLFTRAAKPEGS